MTKPRYGLAVRVARALLENAGVEHAPVPVSRLARECRAVVRARPFDGDLSGMVHVRQDGTAVIGVNANHARTRRRFTVAHELGHLLLHRDEALHVDEGYPIGLRNPDSSTAEDPKEIEANQFAAELLMPAEFVRRDARDLEIDFEDSEAILGLARRYGVSAQAMTFRLIRLKLIRH